MGASALLLDTLRPHHKMLQSDFPESGLEILLFTYTNLYL